MGKTTDTSTRKSKANRQNAAKSTGPRTAEGKGRSRLNALKHGLRAEQVVVLGGPNPEDPQDFQALHDGLTDDRKPAGALETLLIERMAVGFWRLRRAYRFEAESIAQANRPKPMSKMLAELSPLPAREPVEHVLPSLQNLDKLVRYESMIDRELLRSMALLERVQHRRILCEAPAEPQTRCREEIMNDELSVLAATRRGAEQNCGTQSATGGSPLRSEISDCGTKSESSQTSSGRELTRQVEANPEPRITDSEKSPVAERTQPRATQWGARTKHRPCRNLGTGCALGRAAGRCATALEQCPREPPSKPLLKSSGTPMILQRRDQDGFHPRLGAVSRFDEDGLSAVIESAGQALLQSKLTCPTIPAVARTTRKGQQMGWPPPA